MTKQEKLEELGFHYDFGNSFSKDKKDLITKTKKYTSIIDLSTKKFVIVIWREIISQKDIDELQIEFNNLKRDFEEVMKCED